LQFRRGFADEADPDQTRLANAIGLREKVGEAQAIDSGWHQTN
jgi:hypothetical protein